MMDPEEVISSVSLRKARKRPNRPETWKRNIAKTLRVAVLGMTLNCPHPPNHFLNSYQIPLQGKSTRPLTVPVHGSLGVLKPALGALSGVVMYWFRSQPLRSLVRKCSVGRGVGAPVATCESKLCAYSRLGRVVPQATVCGTPEGMPAPGESARTTKHDALVNLSMDIQNTPPLGQEFGGRDNDPEKTTKA
ncbi:hypothetical protein J6590_094454 [Homalodisca vitripennis]|nr:hypothetical protein J6590_094454 [Homalodisca vitripennis]